jgi:hypothetical protein
VARRELPQRSSLALNATIGSYLQDIVHGGCDDIGACFPAVTVVLAGFPFSFDVVGLHISMYR